MEVQVIQKHSLWQNNKTGNIYVVEDILPDFTNAREGELVILYYQATDLKVRGVREKSEFLNKFTEQPERRLTKRD